MTVEAYVNGEVVEYGSITEIVPIKNGTKLLLKHATLDVVINIYELISVV